MNDSELPVHWRFASGQAFAGLRGLVRAFDFLRSANGHTYAGVEPACLVQVIDGFLGEPDGVVLGGDRANLNEWRKLLVEEIQPAHRQGLEAGRHYWHEGDRIFGSLSTEELQRLALELAPSDEMLRGWFAEGFCLAYSIEEMESLRSSSG